MKDVQTRRAAILFMQLGSPKSPRVKDVRKYLKNFLGSPRVVDLPAILWKIILYGFVLPFRPFKSARAYKRIWTGRSFPLISISHDFIKKFRKTQPKTDCARMSFVLSRPNANDLFKYLYTDKFYFIPLFPQYSEATTADCIDVLNRSFKKLKYIPQYEVIPNFHRSKAFIDGSVRQILKSLHQNPNQDHLIISFHGVPTRRILNDKDPYYRHCCETYLLLKDQLEEKIGSLPKMSMTYQSRFGSEPWLGPATDEYVMNLIESHGQKKFLIYCPSFVTDCLETIDEIGNELGEEVVEKGGELVLVPCLNDDDQWVKEFSDWVYDGVNHGFSPKNQTNYQLEAAKVDEFMPEQKVASEPLSPQAKSTLKIVFLTLFLDLIGFSIIFPMFPALAEYYLQVDSQNYFLQLIFSSVQSLLGSAGATQGYTPIVLFGGALGALYSFLQFLAAPFWGNLSDKIGRRPVLIISLSGLALSYLLWFFSGSFTLLIIARLIGGIMAGNISTATAIVADVTKRSNRSKGMAFIGIAFAFGFLVGPAIGGLLTLIDLTEFLPSLPGVNPFSSAAAFAFVLTVINLILVVKKFKETLSDENKGMNVSNRSANPLRLFKLLPYKGVNLTNIGHFFFLTFFSGMEFTLTFLAVERFAYTSLDNAKMFIFIGVIIALVQGGYVRRKANQVGEKRMALQGLVLIVPGLVAIGMAGSTWLLYLGLAFLATGSAMAIPCLTSLASLYTPPEHQGKCLGVFRSLGALGRVVGPILACLLYWKLGSQGPYYVGTVLMLLPILMIAKLPKVETT